MPLPDYPVLIYRGHFRMSSGVSYKDSLLTAEFGGGLETAEVIFPRSHYASLNYSNLHRDALIEVEEDVFVDRMTYLCDFYCNSKDNGNEPFLMKNPRDGKWFLWKFEDDDLTIELMNLFAGSTGLKIKQVAVRGLTPDNLDGSFDEEGS
jgi:hypothetical protein